METQSIKTNPDSIILEGVLKEAVYGDIDKAKAIRSMAATGTEDEHEGIVRAKKAGLYPGVNVILNYVGKDGKIRKGKIVEFRTNVGGLYCGKRYPVNVDLFEEGHIFEYSEEQLIVCEDFNMFNKFKDKVSLAIAIESLQNKDLKINSISDSCKLVLISGETYLETYNDKFVYEIIKEVK